jgi:hypothetical protein
VQPAARLLLVVFAAVALFFQAYAAQTHFHELAPSAAITAKGQAPSAAAPADKHQPSPNDPDTCPLCHSLYNGQYVTPALAAYFLAILSVSIITATSGVSPHYDTVSHSWRGRGPPQH